MFFCCHAVPCSDAPVGSAALLSKSALLWHSAYAQNGWPTDPSHSVLFALLCLVFVPSLLWVAPDHLIMIQLVFFLPYAGWLHCCNFSFYLALSAPMHRPVIALKPNIQPNTCPCLTAQRCYQKGPHHAALSLIRHPVTLGPARSAPPYRYVLYLSVLPQLCALSCHCALTFWSVLFNIQKEDESRWAAWIQYTILITSVSFVWLKWIPIQKQAQTCVYRFLCSQQAAQC